MNKKLLSLACVLGAVIAGTNLTSASASLEDANFAYSVAKTYDADDFRGLALMAIDRPSFRNMLEQIVTRAEEGRYDADDVTEYESLVGITYEGLRRELGQLNGEAKEQAEAFLNKNLDQRMRAVQHKLWEAGQNGHGAGAAAVAAQPAHAPASPVVAESSVTDELSAVNVLGRYPLSMQRRVLEKKDSCWAGNGHLMFTEIDRNPVFAEALIRYLVATGRDINEVELTSSASADLFETIFALVADGTLADVRTLVINDHLMNQDQRTRYAQLRNQFAHNQNGKMIGYLGYYPDTRYRADESGAGVLIADGKDDPIELVRYHLSKGHKINKLIVQGGVGNFIEPLLKMIENTPALKENVRELVLFPFIHRDVSMYTDFARTHPDIKCFGAD